MRVGQWMLCRLNLVKEFDMEYRRIKMHRIHDDLVVWIQTALPLMDRVTWWMGVILAVSL